MARQQLPPQIRKVEVTDRRTGKAVVRYQLTVDAGLDLKSGKRRQIQATVPPPKQPHAPNSPASKAA